MKKNVSAGVKPSRILPVLRKTALATAVMASVALVAAGCSGAGDAQSVVSKAAPTTDTVRSSFMADPNSFAPFDASGMDAPVSSRLLYDTLIRRDAGQTFAPGLATKWEVTPTSGTFTIRKDATCSDGTPITPAVVAGSLSHFSSADSFSPWRPVAFGTGTTTVTSDDAAGTVTLNLSKPWSDMLNGLTLPVAGIVCPAGLKDLDGLKAGTVAGAFSGAYTLTTKEHGVKYEYTLRDDYKAWPQFAKKLEGTPAKKLVYKVNGNQSAIANDLLTDGSDVGFLSGKDMERFNGKDGFSTERVQASSMFMLFNERVGHPFADEAKRKAVAQALDPAAFNKVATGGLGKVIPSMTFSGVACANTDTSILIKTNPAAAADALKGVKIRMIGSQAIGPNGAGATYAAEALRAAGAEVDLQNVDNSTWATTIIQKPESWDLTVMGSLNAAGTLFGAMSTQLGKPVEAGGMNWSGNVNEPVLGHVQAAMGKTDPKEKCASYHEAEKLMITEAHAVPLAAMTMQITTRKGVVLKSIDGFRDDTTIRIVE